MNMMRVAGLEPPVRGFILSVGAFRQPLTGGQGVSLKRSMQRHQFHSNSKSMANFSITTSAFKQLHSNCIVQHIHLTENKGQLILIYYEMHMILPLISVRGVTVVSRACARRGAKRPRMATGGTACEASTPPQSKIDPQWVRRWTEKGPEWLPPILRF